MKKLRNFKCQSGAIIERLVVDGVTVTKCKCGEEAKKDISAARYFGNTTGKSPNS